MNSEFGCLLVMGKIAVASERWYVWHFMSSCFRYFQKQREVVLFSPWYRINRKDMRFLSLKPVRFAKCSIEVTIGLFLMPLGE